MPTTWDEHGNVVAPSPPPSGQKWDEHGNAIQQTAPADTRGLLHKAWDAINTPSADFVLPKGVKTADLLKGAAFEKIFGETYIPGVNDWDTKAQQNFGKSPAKDAVKAFVSGAVKDSSDMAAGFTSPLGLATIGAGALSKTGGAAGTIAKTVGTIAGVGFAGKGAADIAKAGTAETPEAWQQRLEGGAMVAGGAAGATPGAAAAREGIGTAIHTPEGELTPGAQIVGKVGGGAAGAALGSTIGHEYIGAAAGYKLGPSLLDKMFPEAKSTIEARQQFEQAKMMTEAQEEALAKNKQIDAATSRDTIRAQRAAEKAAQDALDARDQTAQDLMDRQAQQDKLDAAATKAQNAAARAQRQMETDHANALKEIEQTRQKDLAAAEKLRTQHGDDLMRRQKQQDALDKQAAQAAQDAEDARAEHTDFAAQRQKEQAVLDRKAIDAAKAAPDMPGTNGQDLISRMKRLVVPGEQPTAANLKQAGDMTQTPTGTLLLLKRMGDKLAENELNRRLKNPSATSIGDILRSKGQSIQMPQQQQTPELPFHPGQGVSR